jgi:hypothetical protein
MKEILSPTPTEARATTLACIIVSHFSVATKDSTVEAALHGAEPIPGARAPKLLSDCMRAFATSHPELCQLFLTIGARRAYKRLRKVPLGVPGCLCLLKGTTPETRNRIIPCEQRPHDATDKTCIALDEACEVPEIIASEQLQRYAAAAVIVGWNYFMSGLVFE